MKKEMKAILHLLNLVVATLAVEPSCPVCSRYDYEEKILERVLRNELALENMLNIIRETSSKAEGALKKLKEENDKVNKAIDTMERKQIVIASELADATKLALINVSEGLSHIQEESRRVIKETNDELEMLKGGQKIPTIHFHARIASSVNVNAGQDVVFTQVEVNKGQGYGPGTGKFTASVAGLYNFAVQYCVQGSKWAGLEIVHNGQSLQRSSHYGSDGGYQCCTMQTYVVMSLGETVWARSTASSYLFQFDANTHTTFTGALVHL